MTARARIAPALALAVIASIGCAAAYAIAASDRPRHASAAPDAAPVAAPAGPFAATTLPADQRSVLAGRVEERLSAGPYSYLRIRPDGQAGDHWIAVSGDAASTAAGQRIRVRVMARAEQFRSRRLGREFAVLLFASITPESSAVTH